MSIDDSAQKPTRHYCARAYRNKKIQIANWIYFWSDFRTMNVWLVSIEKRALLN